MSDKGRDDAALTEPGEVLRGNEPGSTGGRVEKLRADHPGSVSAVSDWTVTRDGLQRGRRDSELLDGRDFNETFWDAKEAALARLEERLGAMEKALRRLERWQPQTKVGMAVLHPEHLGALLEARRLLGAALLGDVPATTNPAGAAKWTEAASPSAGSGEA